MLFAGDGGFTDVIWLLRATHLDRRRAIRTFMRLRVGSECCRLESLSLVEPSTEMYQQLCRSVDELKSAVTVKTYNDIWICPRIEIARHWRATYPFEAKQ